MQTKNLAAGILALGIAATIAYTIGQLIPRDKIPNNTSTVGNIAQLRGLSQNQVSLGARVTVQGYHLPADGGGGEFVLTAENSAPDDAGTVIKPGSGTGRWTRVAAGPLNVRWFGAKGDGVTNDHAAFIAAVSAAAHKQLLVPAGLYLLDGTTISIAANTAITGAGKANTILKHAANADMFNLGDSVSISDLGLQGYGSTWTGRCFVLSGSNGRQSIQNVSATGFDGAIIHFEKNAGSQFSASNCTFARINAATGSGRYAIIIDPAQQLSAVPRKFSHIETNGQCAFDFGGCNDLFIDSSFIGDLKYTSDSRGVLIVNCRIANQPTLTVSGHNNVLVACDLNPQVILAKDADNMVIGPNSYNRQPIIDNSGNGRNLVFFTNQVYLPVASSRDGNLRLGAGTIKGSFTRQGTIIMATIELTIGPDTDLGTGELRFSLPMLNSSGQVQHPGQAALLHRGVYYTAMAQLSGANDFIVLIRDTSGVVTSSSPVVWAAGDIMRISISYTL